MINLNEAMEYIESYDRLGKPVSDLNRIVALMSLLGNPHKDLKFIHIAGTNGKGSVAYMCNEVLIHAGYRVGLFTSPYIIEYSDRIKFNNENIDSQSLCEIVEHLKNVLENVEYKINFSQFEISTAIAFLYFKKMRCDIVVLETGIGGRLDSTNVIQSPIVSIITSISHDHDKILGSTLEEVAYQKAGIIKKDSPCVLSANNPDEVVEVIKKECINKNSLLVIPDYSNMHVFKADVFGSDFYYNGRSYKLKMSGKHQIINALSVIDAIKIVCENGFSVSYNDLYYGISHVKVPARGEVLSRYPLIILDGAHNQAGMKSLADIISKTNCNNCIAVIGMIRDKNVKEAIKEISPYVSEFICVDDFSPQAIPADELVDIIKVYNKSAFSVYDVRLAITEAKNYIKGNDMLLICGSLYLASVARKIILE